MDTREAEVKEISKRSLEALVRVCLAESGSPFPFTIHHTKEDCAGCNWWLVRGPVPKGQSLVEHAAACTWARRALSEEYNLEPEDKESETKDSRSPPDS